MRYRVGNATLVLDRGDITNEHVDAIVNAANSWLLGGGGVDGAIHDAAGPSLLEACREVKKTLPRGELFTGGAVITPGYSLRARHVIHCVGPVYASDRREAPALLASCYAEAMRLCREHGLRSVAFPSISTGAFGYPLKEAAPIALRTIRAQLERPDNGLVLVKLVLFDDTTLSAYANAAATVLT